MILHEQPYEVIVAGHLCLDLVPSFTDQGSCSLHDILIPGRLTQVGQAALSTGGAVSNTGLSLRQLGIKTRLMGKIGSDLLGDVVRKILNKFDASNDLIVDSGSDTSYSIVIAPPGIDRIFLHHPGANDTFCAEDLNSSKINGCRLFHFGYPPLMRRMYEENGLELAKLFHWVHENGATTSLDLALPDPNSPAGQADWPQILEKVLPLTDIFMPSLEELLYMTDRPYFDFLRSKAGEGDLCDHFDFSRLPQLGDRMISYGVRILTIKLGRYGLYIRTGSPDSLKDLGPAAPADLSNWANREIWQEIFEVRKERIASTSGAGDASAAGFLSGLLKGYSIEDSSALACATAALKIQYQTSVGHILPIEAVMRLIPDWPQGHLPIDISASGWLKDSKTRVWCSQRDRLSVYSEK